MKTFEHRNDPLLPQPRFFVRLSKFFGIGMALFLFSLLLGMVGFHAFEHLSWIDAYLNASMLLGGMGPVNMPVTFAGKFFAGSYALFCGLIVIMVAGIMLAPVAHRFLHKFHLERGNTR